MQQLQLKTGCMNLNKSLATQPLTSSLVGLIRIVLTILEDVLENGRLIVVETSDEFIGVEIAVSVIVLANVVE